MFRISCFGLLLLVLIGCSESNIDQLPVKNDIISANSELEAAYLKSSASSVAGMMTKEVIISPVGFIDIHGRKEVESTLGQFFKASEVIKYNLIPKEIDVYGDIIYERGTYVWVSVSLSDKDTSRVNGRYSAVRRLGKDGTWRIHRLIENTIPSN